MLFVVIVEINTISKHAFVNTYKFQGEFPKWETRAREISRNPIRKLNFYKISESGTNIDLVIV